MEPLRNSHGLLTLALAGCLHRARCVSARSNVGLPSADALAEGPTAPLGWGVVVVELPLIPGRESLGLKTHPFAQLRSIRNSLASVTWL
jgi:hypothetical protein